MNNCYFCNGQLSLRENASGKDFDLFKCLNENCMIFNHSKYMLAFNSKNKDIEAFILQSENETDVYLYEIYCNDKCFNSLFKINIDLLKEYNNLLSLLYHTNIPMLEGIVLENISYFEAKHIYNFNSHKLENNIFHINKKENDG